MKADYIIAEIGSTTTVVTAFIINHKEASIIGQGKHYTTVEQGDVTIGLERALEDLSKNIGEELHYDNFLATSSAAGGLKITVHGLVKDMTVKAAEEAALGAGGIIKMVTSGKLRKRDIEKIKEIKPNLIILAGGTDYGERETALYNGELLAEEHMNIPFIYCGNVANQQEIKELFQGQQIYIIDNVYPTIDELNVEPARKIIQEVFEKNIVKAPGMSKIREKVKGTIMTTPGAVMEATKLIYELIGDVVTIDVGGATTDVHSVTEGDSEILDILVSPEPKAKRTVEGDLGIYINSSNILTKLSDMELMGYRRETLLNNIKPLPEIPEEFKCSRILTKKAVNLAINRHVGQIKRIYGGSKNFLAYGKDLSRVKYIVGTGGALTKLGQGEEILKDIRYLKEDMSMLPKKEAKILLDSMYIMASAGVLSRENKLAAELLLKKSLQIHWL